MARSSLDTASAGAPPSADGALPRTDGVTASAETPSGLASPLDDTPTDDGPTGDGRIGDGPSDDGPSDDGPTDDGQTPRPRRATIQDVADAAGVSRAAVSKVIRDAYGVSPQMRERVEAVIDRLDYRPRVAARVMRGKSFTLGLEIPQIGNDFHSVIAAGATDLLAGTPYQLVIAPIRDPHEGDKAIRSLADRQVDGIVAVAPLVSAAWLDDLAVRTPVVMIGRHDVAAHYDTVAGDDEAGAELVMEHLIGLGHRRIAFLDVDRGRDRGVHKAFISPTGRDPHAIRRRVYQEHMGVLGLPPLVVEAAGAMEEDAAEAVHPLVADERSRPTAIFAGHDTLAIGALRAVGAAGLDAGDVSVAGFDDIPIASHPLISLTSVDQQGYAIGQEAVRLLLERIDGRTAPVRTVMPVTLRERGSTAPPRIP